MIARHLGITSRAGVAKHVRALESQGLIKTRNENGRFTLAINQLEPEDGDKHRVEWLECSQDDWPEDWSKNAFPLPGFMLGSLSTDRLCAVLVDDGLMEGDQICEGDVVLLERKAYFRDGDIVAASVKRASPVIRRFYRNGSKVELQPSDERHEPITAPADKVQVLGVYRGLIRPIK